MFYFFARALHNRPWGRFFYRTYTWLVNPITCTVTILIFNVHKKLRPRTKNFNLIIKLTHIRFTMSSKCLTNLYYLFEWRLKYRGSCCYDWSADQGLIRSMNSMTLNPKKPYKVLYKFTNFIYNFFINHDLFHLRWTRCFTPSLTSLEFHPPWQFSKSIPSLTMISQKFIFIFQNQLYTNRNGDSGASHSLLWSRSTWSIS